MRLISLALSAIALVPATNAVFADEAYAVDYHHQLLGVPQRDTTFFYKPKNGDRATLLYTLSDLGVIGAVNPGTGDVVWRQLIEQDGKGFLRAVDGDGWVVSAIERAGKVQAWDAINGRLKWAVTSEGVVRDLEVLETVSEGKGKDALALFEEQNKGILRRLSGQTGQLVWEYKDETGDVPFQISTNVRNVFVVSLQGKAGGYNVKVSVLDAVNGKKTDEAILATKGDVTDIEDVMFVGANSAMPIVAWVDKGLKELKVNILGSNKVQSLALESTDGPIQMVTLHAPQLVQSLPHFLVHVESANAHWADVFHIDLVSGTISKAYSLPAIPAKGAFSTSAQDANVYFTRHTEKEDLVYSSTSDKALSINPIQPDIVSRDIVHGVSEVVSRPETGTYAVRSALTLSDDTWVMTRNGAPAWIRFEGLSGVVAAEWVELPEQVNLARTLEAEAHSSPLAAYLHRVQRHINDLQHLPAYLQTVPQRVLSSFLPTNANATQSSTLARDNFGFKKLVIVATERGRLFGLDAGDHGRVVWSKQAYDLPAGEKWVVKGIFVDNAKGLATIRGSEGEYIIVKTLTGDVVETMWRGSMPPVKATALVESASGKWLMPVGPNGNPGNFPEAWAPKSHVVVQGENGEVNGLVFVTENGQAKPVTTWTFNPVAGDEVLSLTARPAHDPVASIGRVLGDRSVMYKYLNPNTVLVTTISKSASTASFYLLDSVSGEVLYSTTHEGVDISQPIVSLLTENWFVYSLWSDLTPASVNPQTAKGYQLVISELYESPIPNDRGPLGEAQNFSSIDPIDSAEETSTAPHVIAQTFVVPEAISHMAVTQTRQGITSRQLICTLANSNAIVGIPRNAIEARRPVDRDPTPQEMEEGLVKYAPFIDFVPQATLTHRREVFGIKKVITSPALLESTSLVFAYGLDVFGTRVAPSLAFDILGKGFGKVNLLLTVGALAAGVAVVAPMVSRSFPFR
jgi:hypothetical protein